MSCDLVSRKDVLDEIDILEFGYAHHKVVTEFCKRLNANIEKLSTVEQPKWIPVSERLPEFFVNEDGSYCTHGKIVFRSEWDKTVHLGYCIKLIYITDIDTLETIETIEWYDDSGHKWEYITHWMPLPMPPKGDE